MNKKEIVEFKSNPENFEKEKSGIKCNTVRIPAPTGKGMDERFLQITSQRTHKIKIINSETGESFIRDITDVTIWKGIWIISWRDANEF